MWEKLARCYIIMSVGREHGNRFDFVTTSQYIFLSTGVHRGNRLRSELRQRRIKYEEFEEDGEEGEEEEVEKYEEDEKKK